MSTNGSVLTGCEDVFEKKVTEIMNKELLKQNFEETCQRFCMKIIEKAQGIEDDHKDIKKLFNDIGERVDILLADDTITDNLDNDIAQKKKEKAAVIVIDDDDGEEDCLQIKNHGIGNGDKDKILPPNKTTGNPSSLLSNNSQVKKIEDVINKLTSKSMDKIISEVKPKPPNEEKEKTNSDKNIASLKSNLPIDCLKPLENEATKCDENQAELYIPPIETNSCSSSSLHHKSPNTLLGNDISSSPLVVDQIASVSNIVCEDSSSSEIISNEYNLDNSSSGKTITPKSPEKDSVKDSGTEKDIGQSQTIITDLNSRPIDAQPEHCISSSNKNNDNEDVGNTDKKELRNRIPFKSYEKRRNNKRHDLKPAIDEERKEHGDSKDDATYIATKPEKGCESKLIIKKLDKQNSASVQPLHVLTELKSPPRIKKFSFVKDLVVYAKPVKSDIWYQAKLLQEVQKKRGTSYLVQFISGQKPQQKIDKKCIASMNHSHINDVELGTRIVAGRPSDTVNSTIQKKYKDITSNTSFTVMFSGTIAELACSGNRYRYLVFFDDGYAQYLPLNRIFPVVSSSEQVWNDVSSDCQEFIKEYLQEYPFRPLVVTKIGCTMQTEWNGEWWHSRVVSVDSSLVKILFDVDKRSEWIYRGTTRLEPMYNHFVNPPEKTTKGKRGKKSAARLNKEESYVDEIITNPQYGICKYSVTDPQGKQQILKWGKSIIEREKIILKCQEEGAQLKSPRLNSPPAGKKKKRSTIMSPENKDKLKSPSITPPRRKKKLKVEPSDDHTFDTPDLISTFSASDTSVPNVKEEISEADVLGALSALASSPILEKISPSGKLKSPDSTSKSPDGKLKSPDSALKSPDRLEEQMSPKQPSPKRPVKHRCSEKCVTDRRNMLEYHRKGYTNYLSIPFHLGWKRESAKKSFSYHRDIFYRTPCNKRLRNLSEVTKYLLLTKCDNVCIDMFCFHSRISCRSHPSRSKNPKVKKDDLSDGRETCPVVLINDVSDELPPHLAYIRSRNKAEDVFINIDPGFLACCDCTDLCQDKTKCQCAQLTIEQSNAIDGVVDENAGYHYRRLKECITTGIYECNPNCSCSSSCYNRVVQNGIQLRLQVFMTENRGWGLQCIDDIPKGTFICTYAGQILNEQTANREGMDYGDEYLAELDHIEVIEKAKEGYESDVPELRGKLRDGSDSDSFTESESSESVINISSDSSDTSFSDDSVIIEPLTKRPKVVKVQLKANEDISTEDSSDLLNRENTEKADTDPLPETTAPPEKEEAKATSCQVTIKRLLSADIPKEENVSTSPVKPKEGTTKKSSLVPLAKKSTCQVAPKKQQADTTTASKSALTAGNAGESNKKTTTEKLVSTRSLYNNDDQMYVIDAKSFGNVGRFMNHSCSPNLFVQNVMIDTHDLRFPWVAFFAQQNIPAYTELTWDYSYEIGSVPGKTLLCKCGASNCKGRLL